MKALYEFTQYAAAFGPWVILAGALTLDIYLKSKKAKTV